MAVDALVNEAEYFLFYQAVGRNVFLLPLNYLCLRKGYTIDQLPLQFKEKILEVEAL